jgi:hypothetical protein
MGVGGERHTPAALPPGMTRYPLYRRLVRPHGRSEHLNSAAMKRSFVLRDEPTWREECPILRPIPRSRKTTSILGT